MQHVRGIMSAAIVMIMPWHEARCPFALMTSVQPVSPRARPNLNTDQTTRPPEAVEPSPTAQVPEPRPRSPSTRNAARARTAELDRRTRARIEGPAYAHDVRMSAADLARLPREQADAVRRARQSYASLLEKGYQVVVTESRGNQNRPVVVIKPPGFDPAKPANVHTHYHGDGGSAYGDGNPATRQTQAIEEITRANPQTIFVLPSAGRGQHGAQWRGVNQAQTTRDALAGLTSAAQSGELQIGSRTVSFHSAGHGALTSSANTRGGLEADRIELLDSLTSASVDALARWKQGDGKNATISIHEGSPAGLQTGPDAVRRERELVDRLRAAGATLASQGDDHFLVVYKYLQGNVPRGR